MKRKKGDKESNKKIYDMIARYALALVLSINSLLIFYYVFRPLTFFPVVFILKLIYPVKASGIDSMIIGGKGISFVNSCIAGSAYYLFSVLNLSTPGISWIKRMKIFMINSSALLMINISRIILLAIILVNISEIFDTTHFIFWTFLSTIFVAGIWILTMRFYRIKSVPIISDVIYLKKLIKKS